jgi:predicted TIM-barrel fold metal-dependent hydrolase
MWSGTLDRFPGIRIVLSEGGAGWVPYALERAEKYVDSHPADPRHGLTPGERGSLRRPTEIFRDQIYVCIITDEAAISQMDRIGADNLMWEADFPHLDGMWPNSRTTFERSMADVPDEIAIKIGSKNAQRVFGVGEYSSR